MPDPPLPTDTPVRPMFNSIAHRYDFLNHLLSGGIDMYWRRRAVRHLAALRPRRILDVATGTADFAIASLRLRPEEVVGVDVAEGMLERGRAKLRRRGLENRVRLETGRAEGLPFLDGSFDAAIVAFGVRNFEDLRAGLGEMHRVVRPGGMIIVLEFSRPRRFPLRHIYFFYFRHILPLVGRRLSGHAYAYRYLPDTVMGFPDGEAFLAMLEQAGFGDTAVERLTGGVASIYAGVKKPAS